MTAETDTTALQNQAEALKIRLCRLETELQNVTATFSQALEQGSAAVYKRNFAVNIYEYIGSGIRDITGYTPEAITPDLWDASVVSVENKGELAGLPLAEANRRVREGVVDRWLSDTQIRTKTGEIRWVTDLSTVLRDEAGRCYGCLGILFDITDRKKAEQQLAQTTEELRVKNREMQQDLDMAKEIQTSFLAREYTHFPSHVPLKKSALRFSHTYLPASTLAGDFFHIFPVSSHEVGIFVCDVMGHGTKAALVTGYVRGLLEELKPNAAEPANCMRKINSGMGAIMSRFYTDIFATAFYCVADISRGLIRFSNAGHPIPFLLNRNTARVQQLMVKSERVVEPALGLMKEYRYSAHEARIDNDDIIFLFTDGLYEVMNSEGSIFGIDRLGSELEKRVMLHPEDLQEEILKEVNRFSGTNELRDDICIITMHVKQALSNIKP